MKIPRGLVHLHIACKYMCVLTDALFKEPQMMDTLELAYCAKVGRLDRTNRYLSLAVCLIKCKCA